MYYVRDWTIDEKAGMHLKDFEKKFKYKEDSVKGTCSTCRHCKKKGIVFRKYICKQRKTRSVHTGRRYGLSFGVPFHPEKSPYYFCYDYSVQSNGYCDLYKARKVK